MNISLLHYRRLKDLADEFGIEFVDMFTITFPFYRERGLEAGIPSHHYIKGNCEGKPGLVAMQMMFYKPCYDLVKKYQSPFT